MVGRKKQNSRYRLCAWKSGIKENIPLEWENNLIIPTCIYKKESKNEHYRELYVWPKPASIYKQRS